MRKFHMLLDLVLRVPGLYIIDHWWQHERNKSLPRSLNLKEIIHAIIINLVVLNGILMLLLPLPRVKSFLRHLLSFLMLFTGHLISGFYVTLEPSMSSVLSRQLSVVAVQLGLASGADWLLNGTHKPYPPLLGSLALPMLARLLGMPQEYLEMVHTLATTVIALCIIRYVYGQLPNVLLCAKAAYLDALLVTEAHGWTALPILLWNKLFRPNHFLMFWISQMFISLFTKLWNPASLYSSSSSSSSSWGDHWYTFALALFSANCGSPVSLVAMAVSVSYVSYFVLRLTKSFLRWEFVPGDDLYSGWTEGLTLVLFAVQTGLTELAMPTRMVVMMVILFMDLSTLMQSMLNLTEPVLLALSASRSRCVWRHLRAFSMCAFLFFLPLLLTHCLSQVFNMDFWVIVLLSTCILTSIQVVDLLIVHGLFLYDSYRSSPEPWDQLDDLVFYTRGVTKVMELIVAASVVLLGLTESPLGKWNWANSSIVMVHCYFNVWQRLQTGWRSFLLRREAVQKTRSLPAPSTEQLRCKNDDDDDLCPICFVEFGKTACVTPCKHFFHRTCLRKWLYVRDTCPLCHASVTSSSTP